VSALNILNETEINYKAARNKRLHVELALIKLCYLHQAIELATDVDGSSKKKLVETARPVSFRKITPIEVESRKSEGKTQRSKAKLIIETFPEEKISVEEEAAAFEPQRTRLTTPSEGDSKEKPNSEAVAGTTGGQPSDTKLAALDKIRRQVRGHGNYENGSGAVQKPIQLDELQQAWTEYAIKLKSEKNPAGQNFEMAELRVQDANSFIAMVSNNIQLRFIEQQGLKVSQFLREKLQNSQLQFYIVMQENATANSNEAPLTSREQFQKMAEQYPLVKELKDRLRLELDY
jgi:DNA polymerase-3 subunit gamma/tau